MGALVNATTISTRASLERAAHERGIKLAIFAVRERDEIGRALDALIAAGFDVVNILASPLLWAERGRIIDRLNQQRLREVGWSEDRNLAIEYRWTEGLTAPFQAVARVRCRKPSTSDAGLQHRNGCAKRLLHDRQSARPRFAWII
jgi:hypothetical protein